jgi:Gram-negative bacterial TonB protein C-terminal
MRTCCAAVACFVVLVSAAGAQVESPASRLEAASALTSLEGVDQPAWHLKLNVMVFDSEGKNPSEGAIEVWHRNSDERSVYTFADASRTTLKHDGKTFVSATGPSIPFEAEQILTQIVHPGPEPVDVSGAVPELRKFKFGKVELSCVMLTQPIRGAGSVPLWLFPTYCIDANGLIRFTYNFGGQAATLNLVGIFLQRHVATEADIRQGEVNVASAKVVTLATYTPKPNEFVPATDMVEVGPTARVPASVISGHRIGFVEPVYPDAAKIRHASGTVLLHAIIGRDGHIRLLRPTNAADADFVISAIAAVQRWTYRPYLLNGEPTEVDTTITVNFVLNGG